MAKRQHAALQAADTLAAAMANRSVFPCFQEAPINFLPTYRLVPGENAYSNKRNQSPSFTDRVRYSKVL